MAHPFDSPRLMPEYKRENIAIAKIVENFRNGLWLPPETQSDYEWYDQKDKAVRFIRSLYEGRPVPEIWLWKSGGEGSTAWVLDGLSQIVTLCRAMDKRSYLNLMFNPRGNGTKTGRDGQFRVESAVTKKSKEWADVRDVWGNRKKFLAVLAEETSEENRERLLRLRETLNREILVVGIFWHDYKNACEIFDARKMMRRR
jgi:hypothetical protein